MSQWTSCLTPVYQVRKDMFMNTETKGSGELKLQDFTPDQIQEIKEGLTAKVNVTVYARLDFSAIQMRQIRLGLENGVDVSLYAMPDYDWLQMMEIRKGLEREVDVSSYATPSIPYDKMRQLRKGLEQKIDLMPYLDMEAGIIREILKAKLAGFDIMPYIEQGYDFAQLEQIRMAYEHGQDMEPFLNVEYRAAALEEIRIGMESGVDVPSYAKACYTWRQMREIRLGLEKQLNTVLYHNPLYTWRQMREIRLGLENRIPVESYLPLRYSVTDMRERRLALQKEMNAVERNLQVANTNIKAMLEDVAKDEDAFRIVITPDEMEVYLMIRDKDRDFTEEDVLSALWSNKIRKGILRREITKAVNGTYKERSVLVACGQAPRSGKDGYYEFFFKTDVSRKPKLLEDGSVDYQNIEWFETVKQGDKLAYYHPAEEGSNGYNVKGDVLAAMKGNEKGVLVGSGFQLQPDRRTYIASVDGYVEQKDNKLEVSNMLVVEDVSMATGNIVFSGSVYVKGNVSSRAKIQAAGDVMIDGFVESAIIESGGDVVLKQGMNASGYGSVTAGKDVKGKFLEGVTVNAKGNIQVNYCLNCNLMAGDTIEVSGYNGSLVGGTACSMKGITVQNAGNRAGVKTFIKAGINEDLLRQYKNIKDRLHKNGEELNVLENAKAEIERKYPPELCSTLEIYGKLENAIFTENKQREELFEEKAAMEEELKLIDTAKIVVRGRLYEGVEVELNGKRWSSGYMMNVTIRKSPNDMVAVYRN